MEPFAEELGPLLVEQLREQINNLSAAAQLLTPVVREKSSGRYDQYIAIMNQSVCRLVRILNNLEFIQVPEGDEPLRTGTLDLAGLCRQTAEQAIPLAREAGIAFGYEEETGSLLTCGDAALLRRMLLNLISNALHWAAEGGGEAGLRLSLNQERAVLTVWDNGPGLRTLERPERLLLQRPEGLGLGLRVARRIAALHGGSIFVEQREERGLRAIASLPIRPPEGGALLRSPQMDYDASGGFSPVLVELSSTLPYQAFLPEDVE